MASPLSLSQSLLTALVLMLNLAMSSAAKSNAEAEQVVLGGMEPADPNDEEVQKAVEFAIRSYNELSNDLKLSKLMQLLSAKQQVVAWMNHYLKIRLGRTTCTKPHSDLADCPFAEQPDQRKEVICDFEIYDVPWLNEMSMTNFNCQNS